MRRFQTDQRPIYGQGIAHFRLPCRSRGQFHRSGGPGALLGKPAALVADQDLAHHLCRDPQDLGAVLPLDTVEPREPQPGLVHEGRGLERASGTFVPQARYGNAAQLVVEVRRRQDRKTERQIPWEHSLRGDS